NSLQLSVDSQVAQLEIDVRPPQSKGLALAQAQRQRDRVKRLKAMPPDCRKEAPGFCRVERANLVRGYARAVNKGGRVSCDKAPSQGLIQSSTQCSAQVADTLRGQPLRELTVE